MPFLAGAIAAPLLHGGYRISRLSGVGSAPPCACDANLGNQNHSRRQRYLESFGYRRVDHVRDPISITPIRAGRASCGGPSAEDRREPNRILDT